MNTAWSTYVQKAETLYGSRALRFADLFKDKYTAAFALGDRKDILEIGCGPGALCEALRRWYPEAQITGVDRDSYFIEIAKEKVPGVAFAEGDATNLFFGDESFDVTISNTVAEHIEPAKFFGEQYRVLRPGGACIVISARRGINFSAPCVSEQSAFERGIWARVDQRCREVDKQNAVCLYPMSEQEYPLCMEQYGFNHVSTEYITVNLTPDDPIYPKELAHAMINANRQTSLDCIDILSAAASDLVSSAEIAQMKQLANQRYDKRLELYDAGIKQWDANVSILMVMRGIK